MEKIHESGEDYLETILILCKKNDFVRSIDVANELGFSKPSVSRAIKILREKGYIETRREQDDGQILLTQKGMEKAEAIYERHTVLRGFLEEVLGVTPQTSEQDACKIEHIISDESYSKLKHFYETSLSG